MEATRVAFQLASDEAIFPTGIGQQRQTAVGPELSLGTATMRCLERSNQKSWANRANRRNLLQPLRCTV